MSVTVEQFRQYVNTDEVSDFVSECLAAGVALVDKFVGSSVVPSDILDNAYLIASSELFYRRQSPQGITQFGTIDGGVVRAAKDPLNACYPILKPFISVSFG